MMDAQLVLRNIRKTYDHGRTVVLNGIDLTVARGVIVTILGPSGCGKTTLLHIIAGLTTPDTGEVYIAGRRVTDLPPRARNVAMVFQNYALYPHMTVWDNIALALKLQKLPESTIRERIRTVTTMLGIDHLVDRFPRQLSGGQQQRVALARALVKQPDLFLLDEPLSNLDAHIRETTRTEMKRMFHDIHATVIYVTHDQAEALSLSDQIAVMEGGVIRQIADPRTIYHDPAHRFVAEFVGTPRINMLDGEVRDHGVYIRSLDYTCTGVVPARTGSGRILVGIRPEAIRMQHPHTDERTCRGTVQTVEPLGTHAVVTLRIGATQIRAVCPLDLAPPEGTQVNVVIPPDRILLFDPDTGTRIPLREQ